MFDDDERRVAALILLALIVAFVSGYLAGSAMTLLSGGPA